MADQEELDEQRAAALRVLRGIETYDDLALILQAEASLAAADGDEMAFRLLRAAVRAVHRASEQRRRPPLRGRLRLVNDIDDDGSG